MQKSQDFVSGVFIVLTKYARKALIYWGQFSNSVEGEFGECFRFVALLVGAMAKGMHTAALNQNTHLTHHR